MKEEKDDLDRTLENLRSALREQELSADKFKEENWNLEVMLQELRAQVSEAQGNSQRLEGENKRLTKMLTTSREIADQHKNEAERQQTAFEELKAKHETDVAQARKHAASLQRDKSDLQQALDSVKADMAKASRRLPRFGSPLTPNGASASEMHTPADHDDDDVFSAAGASTHTRKKLDNSGLFPPDGFDFADESPDPSPSRPFLAPNHPTNEIEALQQRLAHAQRQISTLKNTLQREKELRMDYRRKLEASPGFAIEEEEDDEAGEEGESVPKPKARLTPYRSSRGRGRGRGRGGLTLIQRLGMAAHSPSSDFNDDVDPDFSPIPSVPPIPAEFRQDMVEVDDDEDPEPPASPSPAVQSNRTSVDGMDPAFANILRRSASAGSLHNGSPLRQSVLARAQRGGTLPRRRGGAAYQEARPPSLVGQPEALAAELGFGMMEPEARSAIVDDLQQELEAVETVDFGVQTDFEEPLPPPPVIQIISPSTSEMAIQVDPEPLPVASTSEVSLQTDAEVAAPHADAEIQAEVKQPVYSAAEIQTATPSFSLLEMQTTPEAVRTFKTSTSTVTPAAAYAAAQAARYAALEAGDSTIRMRRPPSLTLSDIQHLEDEDDLATETGSIMGETQTDDFTDARSVPPTPSDSLSDYHSMRTVSSAGFSDSGSDDESIKASRLHSRNGNFSAMSSTASFPLEPAAIPIPETPAPPELTYESKEIGTDPIPEPPKVETMDEGIQVEPEPAPEPPKVELIEEGIQVEPEPVPEPPKIVVVDEGIQAEPEPLPEPPKIETSEEGIQVEPEPIPEPPKVEMTDEGIQAEPAPEPVIVPEPVPAPLPVPAPEPKPETREMSIQTDEWVPPAPAPVATPAVVPIPIPASVPSAAASVASAVPVAAASTAAATATTAAAAATAAVGAAAAMPTVFRVGPNSQQFQFIPPSSAGPTTPTSVPATVAAPSPNTTIRDPNATFIPRPRTSHSDRRQSIESTLSSVLDDVVSRSRTPSMLPNLIDKSRPPMMVLPPPPRQPPPPNSMLPPPFIPEKRMSHDIAPPRPSSPPPPELIQRATTPSLGVPRGTIGRAHGASMPPSQAGLRQLPSTSSFRSAANAAARAPLSSPSALSFNLRDREQRRELSSASLTSGGQSIGSQRSSISSDHHFETHMRRHSAADGLTVADRAGVNAGTTDPAVIHAITQTMIGEFLYKYTRRAIGKGHGERRHKRFFWVHPYTRTLYWSSADPGSSNVTESSAKSGKCSLYEGGLWR